MTMRPERQRLVSALVSSFHDESESSGSGETLADKERLASRILAQQTREPALRPEELKTHFDDLALKHKVSLRSELAEAITSVYKTTVSVVSESDKIYQSALELHELQRHEVQYLNKDGAPKGKSLAPPAEPLLRNRSLPEMLKLLLELSHQPTLSTQAHAAIILNCSSDSKSGSMYLTPEQKQIQDCKVWQQILKEDPLVGEGWDEDENDSFDSDDWSEDESVSEKGSNRREPSRRGTSSLKEPKHRGDYETDAGLSANLWKENYEKQQQYLQTFREETDQAVAKWHYEAPPYADPRQLSVSSWDEKKLATADAIRELLTRLCSSSLSTDTSFLSINHISAGAAKAPWRRAVALHQHVRVVADTAVYLAATPSMLLQSFGEALSITLEEWNAWLASEDSRLAQYAAQRGDSKDSISLLTTLRIVEQRAAGLNTLYELVASEQEAAGFDAISLVNKVHALILSHQTTRSPVNVGVEKALSRCFSALAKPLIGGVSRWLMLGAPFDNDLADGERAWSCTSELFKRDPSVSCFDDKFWTAGYTYATDQGGQPHVPAFMAPHAKTLLQAGMSIGLLRAFRDEADVPPFDRPTSFSLQYDSSKKEGMEIESAIPMAQAAIQAMLPQIRLSQKRAHDYYVLPTVEDGRDLYGHLTAIQDLFLMRRGAEMHAWCEEIFLKIASNEAIDAQTLTTALRDSAQAEQWLDTSLVSFKFQSAIVKDPFSLEWVRALQIGYAVPWPLTFVISGDALSLYRSTFSLLLSLKRVKHLVDRIGRTKPGTAAERSFAIGLPDPKQLYPLRRRLIWLVNTFTSYCNTDVIGKFNAKLGAGLSRASSVNGLIEAHDAALRDLRKHLFLDKAHAKLHTLMLELLRYCMQVAHCHFTYQSGGMAKLVVAPPQLRSRHRRRRRRQKSLDSDSDENMAQVMGAFAEAAALRQRSSRREEGRTEGTAAADASLSVSTLHVSTLSISAVASASLAELQEADFEQQLATLDRHFTGKVAEFKATLQRAIEQTGGEKFKESRETLQNLAYVCLNWA
ncbi:hypothetical protein K437DRAFT_259317 [Tilletiaria anomala UBC 951]|uniref:Spindle pole body component n=1 Tax=Tilletiaria anomala (strain ATCC 24038 / CBS 436.72 / UBC 951) TaxID=1037660 RepID=A0A066VB68_TILAU|nr:uncharacterized protein K437DRAFT_259317 [Tilletiaria anomala UBC 951]KDN38711.1 hypothetical protein K437DRAFT_259317 [Tilletiaria anomala UBC 951]